MPILELFLLGPPEVVVAGRPVEIRRRKALALLAYLAIAGYDQRRDTLGTLFWPDTSHSQARANLRRDLAALNNTPIEAWLAADRETVALHRDNLRLDVTRFRELLTPAEDHNHAADEPCSDCLTCKQNIADKKGNMMGCMSGGWDNPDSMFKQLCFISKCRFRDRGRFTVHVPHIPKHLE